LPPRPPSQSCTGGMGFQCTGQAVLSGTFPVSHMPPHHQRLSLQARPCHLQRRIAEQQRRRQA
jgi:hypothetical protein